ncbi:hypothetical protein RHRU231_450206 [Rhodococcus ruber]|uniref:Uncharacterized protein n=1 Tax=Rhodococcus ruber TaxID=1830 RepID=A0A098BJV6_9NOCA|nr:hypothetical protein RHRU231_450206 [Rhodococcus ruber]
MVRDRRLASADPATTTVISPPCIQLIRRHESRRVLLASAPVALSRSRDLAVLFGVICDESALLLAYLLRVSPGVVP